MFQAIEKNTAPEMVARQILERIEKGDLKPGQRLPSQRELAEALGVGRSSIREAINALAVMGYLEVCHGKGTFVRAGAPPAEGAGRKLAAAIEAGSLLDLLEVRQVLECKSAALAAERADADQVRALRRALDTVRAAPAGYEAFLRADLAFHRQVAEAGGNPVICEMIQQISAKVVAQHARLQTGRLSSDYRRRSIETAQDLIEAIEQGDGPAAARHMASHLNLIQGELDAIIS